MAKYTVKTEKLYDGKVYKNFKALVEDMEWKYYKPTTTSAQAQMKALDEVCRWGKDEDENGKKRSNKIIIHEVYKVKKLTKDGRKVNANTLLTRLVGRSILEVLADYNEKNPKEDEAFGNNQQMEVTLGGLYTRIGLVNENYLQGRNRQYELSARLNLPIEHVNDFYSCVHDSLKATLYKALNDLHNQRLVRHQKTKRLVFKSAVLNETDLQALHEDSIVQVELVAESEYADYLQYDFIFDTERELLSRYGFRGMNEVYAKDRHFRDKFFKEVVDTIRQKAENHYAPSVRRLTELDYYYNALQLSFYSPHVLNEIQRHQLTVEEREQIRDFVGAGVVREYLKLGSGNHRVDINNAQMKRVHNNAESRHSKAKKNLSKRDEKFNRLDEEYVENIDCLAKAVIDRQTSFKMKGADKNSKIIVRQL